MSVRANELKDVKIRKISLVDRGAARAPFKIQKRDGEGQTQKAKGAVMSLLDKVFKRQPIEPIGPSVVAVMINKSADLAAVQARMKAAGLDLAEKTDVEGGGVVLHAAGYEEAADDVVMKFDDNFAAVIRGVKKGLLFPEQSTAPAWTFADDFTSNGILPGIDAALSALNCAVWNAIYTADNPGDATTKVNTLFDEGKSYVNAVIGAIPSTAYKMDKVVAKASYPLTSAGSGVADVTGKFPMEGSGRDGCSTDMGADGGSKGVDPTAGSDIDGDGDGALTAVGGIHKGDTPVAKVDPAGWDEDHAGDVAAASRRSASFVADGSTQTDADKQAAAAHAVPVSHIQAFRKQKEDKVAKGDGDTTGSAADGPGADNSANAGGNSIGKGKTQPAKKTEGGPKDDKKVDDQPVATRADMPHIRVKAADAPGGDSGFYKGTGNRPSVDGEASDEAVDVTAPPKGGGQAPAGGSVIKDELARLLAPISGGIDAIAKEQRTLAVAVKGLQDAQDGLSTRVQKAEEGSRRVVAAMRGTLQTHEGDADTVPVVKSEMNGADSGAGLIDTAYDRHLQQSD